MQLHSATPLSTVQGQGRLLNQSNRQQSRNRQRSMLMRSIQQVAPEQL